jgi:CheY-like chemotaxis protein
MSNFDYPGWVAVTRLLKDVVFVNRSEKFQMATPSKRQIFVVDDDPSVRDSVAKLLTSAGYDVAAAEDGLEALLQLNKVMPDVIVSDLNMPRVSGFYLLSVVRRCFPGIVTVAISGAYRNSELPPEVIANGFYSKGDHPTNLFGSLVQLLGNVPARSA